MLDNIQPKKTSNPAEVLMDLLNPKTINLKTDLSISQIKELCKVYHLNLVLSKSFHIEKINDMEVKIEDTPIERLNKTMEYFKELLTSKNRLREKAIIQGLKNIQESEDNEKASILDKIK